VENGFSVFVHLIVIIGSSLKIRWTSIPCVFEYSNIWVFTSTFTKVSKTFLWLHNRKDLRKCVTYLLRSLLFLITYSLCLSKVPRSILLTTVKVLAKYSNIRILKYAHPIFMNAAAISKGYVNANCYVFIVKLAQYMSNDPTKVGWTKLFVDN